MFWNLFTHSYKSIWLFCTRILDSKNSSCTCTAHVISALEIPSSCTYTVHAMSVDFLLYITVHISSTKNSSHVHRQCTCTLDILPVHTQYNAVHLPSTIDILPVYMFSTCIFYSRYSACKPCSVHVPYSVDILPVYHVQYMYPIQ